MQTSAWNAGDLIRESKEFFLSPVEVKGHLLPLCLALFVDFLLY